VEEKEPVEITPTIKQAVDEKEQAAYGKSMEKTKIKPVFVDMIAPEDIEAALKGE
jgi:hypothetical protein